MRTRSLSDLIRSVRRRTNMETSEFVTDDEITEFLNEEWAELQSRLTSNECQPHFVTIGSINVTVGTSLYGLPADFWRLLSLKCSIDGVNRTMAPFMEGERASLENASTFDALWSTGPRYRLQADNIEILPATRSYTAELRYIGSCPFLVDAGDTLDGINGWEAALIAGACASVREKEETDPMFFAAKKDRLYKLIDGWVQSRDASHPERVTDVTGGLDSFWWPGSGWL